MTISTQALALKIITTSKAPSVGSLSEITNELNSLPIIVQYYLIKGLKSVNFELLSVICDFERTLPSELGFIQIIREVLKALYTEEDEYQAYKGLGSLEEFSAFFKTNI
jgi:hypothetical protein